MRNGSTYFSMRSRESLFLPWRKLPFAAPRLAAVQQYSGSAPTRAFDLDQIQGRRAAEEIEKHDRLKKAGSINDADLRLRAKLVQ
jgi:hypothetical protein